jgi:hypothetical protein
MKIRSTIFGPVMLILLVIIFISIGAFISHSQETKVQLIPVSKVSYDDRPVLKLLSQPSSPLKISRVVYRSPDIRETEASFYIENVGKKPIIAYTIRSVEDCGGAITNGYEIHNIMSPSKIILSGQSIEDAIIGSECSQAGSSMTISFDFIEFADGKNWGEDIYKSSQRLAGMRAGARDESDTILLIIKERDTLADLNALPSEVSWAIPRDHSEEWNAGYKDGRSFRRNQVEKAFSESGLHGIREKLSHPYDASGKEKK